VTLLWSPRFVEPCVDEVVVVADEILPSSDLGIIASAKPSSLHVIPHVTPNERATAFTQQLSTTDWLPRVCGDEIPSLKLMRSLRDLVADDRVTHYRIPIHWLWPDCDHTIYERPWWPDRQPRLFRNNPAVSYISGRTHSGFEALGPHKLLCDPIYHLDLLLTSEEERMAKTARYDQERPGLELHGKSLNHVMYFPSHTQPSTAVIAVEDAAQISELLMPQPDIAHAQPVCLTPYDLESLDETWNSKEWPEEAFRAQLKLCELGHERHLQANDHIELAVENQGNRVWPNELASWPLIRVAYRLWSENGYLVCAEGVRTGFTAAVSPGETAIVEAKVALPSPGTFIAEFDVVYETVRWLWLRLACETGFQRLQGAGFCGSD